MGDLIFNGLSLKSMKNILFDQKDIGVKHKKQICNNKRKGWGKKNVNGLKGTMKWNQVRTNFN